MAADNAERIFRFYKGKGFSDEQSAAFVGNYVQESGLNPAIVQPNGQGHGLAQWGGGRFAALQAFAGSRGTAWTDLDTQLEFSWHELQGSESSAYRAIKGAGSVEAATNAVGVSYERYGIKGDRSGPAKQFLARFRGLSGTASRSPAADPSSTPTSTGSGAGLFTVDRAAGLKYAMTWMVVILAGLAVALIGVNRSLGGAPAQAAAGAARAAAVMPK